MGRQHDFGMNDAAFPCVVMGHSVPLIRDFFAASVGGCAYGRLAFSTTDNADVTMINRYGYHLR